jgi:hypothetical protein
VARSVGGSAAAEAVAPKVWYVVGPEMKKEIRSETYNQLDEDAKALGTSLDFEESDIVVDLPDHPTFSDPYEHTLDGLQKQNGKEKDGFRLDFTMPDMSEVKVDLSDLNVVTEQ